jgi:SMODS-associating 2TM, beta-strand rich effector domain
MHAYATNANNRKAVFGIIAIPSFLAAVLINSLVQAIKLPFLSYIGTPAIAGCYGLILLIYDRFLWSKKIGPLSFSHIPNIRGTWVGKIHSSFHNVEVQVVVYIEQSWSELSMMLETESSISSTTMAVLNIGANIESGLRYEYRNEGKAYGTTPDHRGTGHVMLSPDGNSLEGKYYTSEGSNNTGTIGLKLLSRKHLSRDKSIEQAKRKHYI